MSGGGADTMSGGGADTMSGGGADTMSGGGTVQLDVWWWSYLFSS